MSVKIHGAGTESSENIYKHKNSLPMVIIEVMHPITRDLSHPDLLKNCVGKPKRKCSCVRMISSPVPKSTFADLNLFTSCLYDVVYSFNDEFTNI
ncbi:hypothetical protein TNIN_204001 [Trichonephila inaurata madagascariensis]|uniref:Uncharacterized protein n=1 Tax=Trichonephila inaurata madagascariensis TaxID=2747483 RepID=A0A8X6X6H7_9ARAC|nr:hypothetical protein TNIN_204001 [Trichonephila inaurata madagascariensis]